jgi:serine protease Do
MQSVVKVTQIGRGGDEGIGAGWVMDAKGLIVTNFHVIGRGRKLRVETHSGEKHEVTAVHAWDEAADLAILKVNATGLKAFKVGDSTKAKQGQPVAAIGNPEGLEFSFVQGVISGIREIDDQQMLQVALPIERGNSGGPLINRQGEVVGILTLKSMKSDNLGFAIPSLAARALSENPNSLSMDAWATIGVLDPRTWGTLNGADWQQRAGVLKVSGLGSGFGGRTMALWKTQEPQGEYEVSVKVKLEEESGAAGLLFCGDGKDRHYGFYPSGGGLRLTRFEGADYYSWEVLRDAAAPTYRPGEWNELRVRVTAEDIHCWVNGELWHVSDDTRLRGGQVGLCRFRSPAAEFKQFRVGADLSPLPVDEELVGSVRRQVEEYVSGRQTQTTTVEVLRDDPAASLLVVQQEIEQATKSLESLRKLQRLVHESAVTADLVAALEKKDGLLTMALLLAKHDNPELDPAPYVSTMDRMEADLADDPEIREGGIRAIKRLNQYLFEQNGFHVTKQDFSNSSSYINEVMDDREGLPIMLATVYLELASRLGLKELFGASLPGRFMVGIQEDDPDEPTRLIDVAGRGRILSLAQAADVIGLLDGSDLLPYLAPATEREMILRMVLNLQGEVPAGEPPTEDQVSYLSLQIALDEESSHERFLRAAWRSSEGDKAGAREDLMWLMEHGGPRMDGYRLQKLQEWYHSLEP